MSTALDTLHFKLHEIDPLSTHPLPDVAVNPLFRSKVFVVLDEARIQVDRMTCMTEGVLFGKIFIAVFGEKPTCNEDPRWDYLLCCPPSGLGARRVFNEYLDILEKKEKGL